MIYEDARRDGCVMSTTLVGSRENVDKCLSIGRAVEDHEHKHFPIILEELMMVCTLASMRGEDTDKLRAIIEAANDVETE